MYICIACQIGNHEMCRREPECDCECQDKGDKDNKTLFEKELSNPEMKNIYDKERKKFKEKK